MFHRFKNKETKKPLNNKGFSLIEILIAVGILAILVVPMAMNMITGARLNSKSKQAAASSDITTSIMEIMQTIDLSDILTDVNWTPRDEFDVPRDEYGIELDYTLTGNALLNYKIAGKMEVIQSEDGKSFKPVAGQYDENGQMRPDYLVNSSIKFRETTDGLKKAYFTGQESEKYAFLLKGVETDEANLDILVTVVPEQKFEIVNITSMAQSEVIFAKQKNTMNQEVAAEFKAANDVYVALKGDGSVQSLETNWILNNMTRVIQIDLEKDTFSEATTIKMTAIYTLESNAIRESDKTITKKLGSFSTNSTFEYARGIYLYFNPLLDNSNGTSRDHIVINNKNEISAPVFLIAIANDAALDLNTVTNYHPSLSVNEKNDTAHKDKARTTVCSNVSDSYWKKTMYPIDRVLDVKALGNSSWQQTLYKATIKIYTHRDDAFADDGTFTPSAKYLLIENTGTFIDTSEILDIASDSQSSVTGTPGVATADVYRDIVYDGNEHRGVYGNGVMWSGITKATNAGTYVAKATPLDNYKWSDGSNGTKTLTWEIKRSPIAEASGVNHTYSAQEVTGVLGKFVEFGGTYKTDKVGNYTAYVTPDSNHAWPDGSSSTKTIKWRISPKQLTVVWGIGNGLDVWSYDGQVHYATCTVQGVFSGDTCTVSLSNYAIKDVGSKTARITGISNSNYRLPDTGLEHKITVTSAASAYVELQEEQYLVYDGQVKTGWRASEGVYFSGTYSATNAGTYTFTAHLKDGYTWEGGGTGNKDFTWTITQRQAVLAWGENTWVYNTTEHKTTCVVSNVVFGDTVTVTLQNNSITNVGTVTVKAISLSNPNYKLASPTPTYKISVTRSPTARVVVTNHKYTGGMCVGITGQNVTYEGVTKAVNINLIGTEVHPYNCKVTPMSNYAWEDGTTTPRTFSWMISPLKDVSYDWSNFTYSGLPTTGIFRVKNATVSGDIEKTAPGTYTAIITPNLNHAWPDGSVAPRKQVWKIQNSSFNMPTLKVSSFVYDGKSHSPTFTEDLISDGYVISGDLSATNANIGDSYYCITVALRDTSGAAVWDDGTTAPKKLYWRIEPKEVGISWSANVWTYNRTERTATATCTGLVSGDTCSFTYSDNKRTNAGSQTFTITGTTNTNYKIPTSGLSNTMTINKKEVGINWGTTTWIYGNTEYTVSPTATGVESGDTCTFTVVNNKRTRSGSQTVEITGISNNNYKLPTTGLSTTMTINKKAVTITWGTTSWTYDKTAHTAYATANGICGGETYNLTYSGNTRTDAGSQTASVTGITNGTGGWSDYSLPSDTSQSITVLQREITISWGTVTWDYDETEHTVSPTAGNVCSGDTVTITASDNKRTNAGSQTVTATAVSNGNYKLPSSVTATLTINRAAVVTMKANGNFTYDGNNKYGVTFGPVDGNNTKYLSYTGHRYNDQAGTYTCTATLKDNYAWSDGTTGSKSVTWSIAKAEISCSWWPSYTETNYNATAYYTGGSISWTESMPSFVSVPSGTNISGTQSYSSLSVRLTVSVTPDSNHKWNSTTKSRFSCEDSSTIKYCWSIQRNPAATMKWTGYKSEYNFTNMSRAYGGLQYAYAHPNVTISNAEVTNYTYNGTTTKSVTSISLSEASKKPMTYKGQYGYFFYYAVPKYGYAWSSGWEDITAECYNNGYMDDWEGYCKDYKITFDGYPYGGKADNWSVVNTEIYDGKTKN